MRQIKFRGKRTDNGEWVYGSLLIWENGDCEIMVQKSPVDCDKISVDADTVGQFTGLLDKNGKDIYEGDIVAWTDSDGNHRIDVVKWMNGGLCLCNSGSVVKPGGYSISAINDRRLIEDNSDVIILKNNTISMFRSIPSLI